MRAVLSHEYIERALGYMYLIADKQKFRSRYGIIEI